MKPKADHILDFRDTLTPLALLKMTQVLKDIRADQTMEIITRDPDARSDILKVIPFSVCELIGIEFDEETNTCRIRVKKTR